MAVSKKIRFEVFKRDLFTCRYCGRRPPDVVLECDHIIAVAKGGSDEMDNLTTSCWDCNRGKAARSLDKTPPAVDELSRLAAIQDMAERSAILLQEQRENKKQERAIASIIETFWGWWADELSGHQNALSVIQDSSLRLFIRRGLTTGDLREALDRTVAKAYAVGMNWDAVWRYFCGVCWGMIRDRAKEDIP